MLAVDFDEVAVHQHRTSSERRSSHVRDTVDTGSVGRCGNSGNTSEPHLHFHLQDAPALDHGTGLPAIFYDYYADGQLIERGQPVKGDVVGNAP